MPIEALRSCIDLATTMSYVHFPRLKQFCCVWILGRTEGSVDNVVEGLHEFSPPHNEEVARELSTRSMNGTDLHVDPLGKSEWISLGFMVGAPMIASF